MQTPYYSVLFAALYANILQAMWRVACQREWAFAAGVRDPAEYFWAQALIVPPELRHALWECGRTVEDSEVALDVDGGSYAGLEVVWKLKKSISSGS